MLGVKERGDWRARVKEDTGKIRNREKKSIFQFNPPPSLLGYRVLVGEVGFVLLLLIHSPPPQSLVLWISVTLIFCTEICSCSAWCCNKKKPSPAVGLLCFSVKPDVVSSPALEQNLSGTRQATQCNYINIILLFTQSVQHTCLCQNDINLNKDFLVTDAKKKQTVP